MKIQNSKIKIQKLRDSIFLNLKSLILNSRKGGFTLIELVITMVLMAIVALIVANALSTVIKGTLMTDDRKEAMDQARIAMERMTREIRNLRDSDDVNTGNATQFCFTDTDGVQINYSYSNPNIKREAPSAACTPGNGQTLATGITGITPFSFEYIKANGTVDTAFVDTDPDAPATDTKRIRITIPCTISGETVTLQSEVWPRNL